MRKSRHTRVAAVLIAIVFAMAIVPTYAYARTVKTKVFYTAPTVSQFTQQVKAVKKGTNKVKFSANDGYVKFTATKTKTYTFIFSNAKPEYETFATGIIKKLSGAALIDIKVKTTEGKRVYLPICDATTYKNCKAIGLNSFVNQDGKRYKYVPKRSAKMKLNKGQTIYLDISGTKSGSLTLKIK